MRTSKYSIILQSQGPVACEGQRASARARAVDVRPVAVLFALSSFICISLILRGLL